MILISRHLWCYVKHIWRISAASRTTLLIPQTLPQEIISLWPTSLVIIISSQNLINNMKVNKLNALFPTLRRDSMFQTSYRSWILSNSWPTRLASLLNQSKTTLKKLLRRTVWHRKVHKYPSLRPKRPEIFSRTTWSSLKTREKR